MANDTNISREAKKKQLRRQVISSEELKKNKDYQRRRKQKRLQNWMVILGAIVLVAVVVLGVYIYETNRTYKTFASCSWAATVRLAMVTTEKPYGRFPMI